MNTSTEVETKIERKPGTEVFRKPETSDKFPQAEIGDTSFMRRSHPFPSAEESSKSRVSAEVKKFPIRPRPEPRDVVTEKRDWEAEQELIKEQRATILKNEADSALQAPKPGFRERIGGLFQSLIPKVTLPGFTIEIPSSVEVIQKVDQTVIRPLSFLSKLKDPITASKDSLVRILPVGLGIAVLMASSPTLRNPQATIDLPRLSPDSSALVNSLPTTDLTIQFIGKELGPPIESIEAANQSEGKTNMEIYVVQKGDTVSKILSQYGLNSFTDMVKFANANPNLFPGFEEKENYPDSEKQEVYKALRTIYPGNELNIPTPPSLEASIKDTAAITVNNVEAKAAEAQVPTGVANVAQDSQTNQSSQQEVKSKEIENTQPLNYIHETYTVKPDDNLIKIIKEQFGINPTTRVVHEILKANPQYFPDLGFEFRDSYTGRQFRAINLTVKTSINSTSVQNNYLC